MNHRAQRLLNPNSNSDVQIEMYSICLGTIKKGDGPVTILSVSPSCVFRPIRIAVNAHKGDHPTHKTGCKLAKLIGRGE